MFPFSRQQQSTLQSPFRGFAKSTLAYLQLLPGSKYPRMVGRRQLGNHSYETKFRFFLPYSFPLQKNEEKFIFLNIRFAFNNSCTIDFVPLKYHNMKLTPCVNGSNLKYISNFSMGFKNIGQCREFLYNNRPVLDLVITHKSNEVALRRVRNITTHWDSSFHEDRSYFFFITEGVFYDCFV
jgi:hypothetical protein